MTIESRKEQPPQGFLLSSLLFLFCFRTSLFTYQLSVLAHVFLQLTMITFMCFT